MWWSCWCLYLIGLLWKKLIVNLEDVVFCNCDIVFVDENFGNVAFSSDQKDILSVDINNNNLHDVDFDEDDPKTITHEKLMTWHNRFKQHKTFKKRFKQRINASNIASYKEWDSWLP